MCARRHHDPFGFGAGAWWWPGGQRHGFRGKVFDRGDLKFMILRLLARKSMHGYEVMQALEQESGGWYAASAGSVYPVLQMLQDQGYVSSEERDGKRVYSITAEGRAFLERNRDRVDDVLDRVSDVAERFSGGAMGEVARAFMRLAQASFEEAMRHSNDAEAMKRVREILERATRDIQATESAGAK
jgi:DNA-binding PadR family transcriptional regulator